MAEPVVTEEPGAALRAFLARGDHDRTLRRIAARRAFSRLGDEREGEDVLLEAYSRALPRWAGLSRDDQDEPDDSRRMGWLVRFVENIALERARARKQARKHLDVDELDDRDMGQCRLSGSELRGLVDPTGELVVQRELLRELLPAAMDQLPRRCRAVMQRHLDGASDEDIAEELGITASSVRSRLARARDALTQQLRLADTPPRSRGETSA